MARKITEDSISAFIAGREFSRGNMSVIVDWGTVRMYLHGNLIAERPTYKALYETRVTNAGWYSNTTKERLGALLWELCRWHLSSVNGQWILWTNKHGEEKPFRGSVTVRELLELDITISQERDCG
jgi:hypothetical protein